MQYVFGFNSGQEAIQAALTASGISRGDAVIMPSYCCETVLLAVLNTGARPLFCDINADCNPDNDHIISLITDNVKAIIYPHLFGNPGSLDKLEIELSKRKIRSKILIIDDAAQSFGALLNGKLLGTFGDAGIISFGPGKTMTATGGGLLITNSSKLAVQVNKLNLINLSVVTKLKKITYWVAFRRWRKYTLPFFKFFKFFLKFKDKNQASIRPITNIDAGIALEQFRKLDIFLSTRIKRKNYLDNFFSKMFVHSFSSISCGIPEIKNVSSKYIVKYTGNEDTKSIYEKYKKYFHQKGIEIMDLYTPVHRNSKFIRDKINLPVTEKMVQRLFQIPLEPSIKEKQFLFIVDLFQKFALDHTERIKS